jgi:predicted histone-like DNA-binding protein
MIYYTLAPKKNVLQPEMPIRYYAIAVSRGTADLRSIAESISQRSSVSTIDTMAVIEALLNLIPEELAEGRIVKLGDFGSFSLSIRSEGIEDPAKFHPSKIGERVVHFRAGKEFRKRLVNLKFGKDPR